VNTRRRPRLPVRFGTLRRTTPLSAHWGFDRGTPVDRFFIERFLDAHRKDVSGRVLEVLDDRYTQRYGSDVTASDVLDVDGANPNATLVGDLGVPSGLPEAAYDCLILTQTLQYVFDLEAAVDSVARLLAPGGVVLATVPALGRIDATGGLERDFWRFTAISARRLFERRFAELEVETNGNVLLGAAFLFGLAAEELRREELEANDPLYPVVVTVRARR
jgi:SAM-dependent methyltransferase